MLKLVQVFHARGSATENARSPKIDRRTVGTIRVDTAEELPTSSSSCRVSSGIHDHSVITASEVFMS